MRIKKKHQYGSHRLAVHTRWRLQAAATQTNAPYGAWRGQIISPVAARYLEDCALQIASPAIIG